MWRRVGVGETRRIHRQRAGGSQVDIVRGVVRQALGGSPGVVDGSRAVHVPAGPDAEGQVAVLVGPNGVDGLDDADELLPAAVSAGVVGALADRQVGEIEIAVRGAAEGVGLRCGQGCFGHQDRSSLAVNDRVRLSVAGL